MSAGERDASRYGVTTMLRVKLLDFATGDVTVKQGKKTTDMTDGQLRAMLAKLPADTVVQLTRVGSRDTCVTTARDLDWSTEIWGW